MPEVQLPNAVKLKGFFVLGAASPKASRSAAIFDEGLTTGDGEQPPGVESRTGSIVEGGQRAHAEVYSAAERGPLRAVPLSHAVGGRAASFREAAPNNEIRTGHHIQDRERKHRARQSEPAEPEALCSSRRTYEVVAWTFVHWSDLGSKSLRQNQFRRTFVEKTFIPAGVLGRLQQRTFRVEHRSQTRRHLTKSLS